MLRLLLTLLSLWHLPQALLGPAYALGVLTSPDLLRVKVAEVRARALASLCRLWGCDATQLGLQPAGHVCPVSRRRRNFSPFPIPQGLVDSDLAPLAALSVNLRPAKSANPAVFFEPPRASLCPPSCLPCPALPCPALPAPQRLTASTLSARAWTHDARNNSRPPPRPACPPAHLSHVPQVSHATASVKLHLGLFGWVLHFLRPGWLLSGA